VSGRHRLGGIFGAPSLRTTIALGGVAALVAVTVVAVRAVAADADGCSNGVRLTIAAAPEIAPAVHTAATRWVAANPRVAGQCVRIQVNAVSPADVAHSLATRAGGQINVAAQPTPTPGEDQVPAVWIPDSQSWIERVRTVDRDVVDQDTPSVAMSPVVLAMPEALARVVQSGNPGGRLTTADLQRLLKRALESNDRSLQLGVAEPRRDAASLAGALLLHDAIVTAPNELPRLVGVYRGVSLAADQNSLLSGFGREHGIATMSEQAVLAYDRKAPPVPLAVVPIDGAPALDYPFSVVSGKPRGVARAAELFRSALVSPAYRDIFAATGFRGPDGIPNQCFPAGHGATTAPVTGVPLGDLTKISNVINVWSASRTPSRVLTLVDVTSSMATRLPVPANPGATRLNVLQQTAIEGLKLFTNDSEMGLWGFANGLPGGKDYRELVPIGPLDGGQRNKINTSVLGSAPLPTNNCGLYESVLAAYQTVKDGFNPAMSNAVVVFVDGRNSRPGGMDLDRLQVELEKLADPTKPIRVVLLGIGPDIDLEELNAIAKTTGGKAFQVTEPERISEIFLQALLRIAV
jgi:hypothetical protein